MSTVGTPRATKTRYAIDAKGSTFAVRAFATGMLSAFGHNPTIAIPDLAGEVQFDPDAAEVKLKDELKFSFNLNARRQS